MVCWTLSFCSLLYTVIYFQYELFEEAFLIYTKCGKKAEGEEKTSMHVSAAEVYTKINSFTKLLVDRTQRVLYGGVPCRLRRCRLVEHAGPPLVVESCGTGGARTVHGR